MKNLFSVMLVSLLVVLPVMTAFADEAAISDQGSPEAVSQDNTWDEPTDIEYVTDEEEIEENAEESSGKEIEEDATKEAAEEEKASPFVGEWLCENASIFIDEQDGAFNVYILWDISDTEEDIWEYSCTLNNETGVLTGVGKKNHEVSNDEGEVVSAEEIYADGSATFSLDEDALIWADAKEDIAHGLRFERSEEEEPLEEYDEAEEPVGEEYEEIYESEDGETEDGESVD